ncbi:ROK family protein [Alkalihalobacillus sp. AL-G]|uniref:ROK family protein n=1 Tax=Alkalihalobacillus sp. AL-G TaxID=2926399 RepID=UPI00272B239C|nr:ROK family protein [Alkalihalobacillus sp. AL-G]WLD93071.1 ROK family protein [Alkalihalobacillus sp. AL-G]
MNILGVDIGGTTIKGAVFTSNGEKIAQSYAPTDVNNGRDGIIASLFKVIDQLMDDVPVVSIGIGTAGRVNAASGEVVYATDNLPGWGGMKLKDLLSTRYDLPVVVDNDANTALVGELWKGISGTYQSAVMLTLGTGVGGANVMNGKLVHGRNWQGGEWGHSIFVPDGLPCNCGQQGCIEQYLSGSALVRMAHDNGLDTVTDGKHVFEQFNMGNQAAKHVINRYFDDLVTFLTTISNGIDPDIVIVGGGVVESKDFFWDLFEKKLQDRRVPIQVKPAMLGNEAGIYGAVKLALGSLSKEGT